MQIAESSLSGEKILILKELIWGIHLIPFKPCKILNVLSTIDINLTIKFYLFTRVPQILKSSNFKGLFWGASRSHTTKFCHILHLFLSCTYLHVVRKFYLSSSSEKNSEACPNVELPNFAMLDLSFIHLTSS